MDLKILCELGKGFVGSVALGIEETAKDLWNLPNAVKTSKNWREAAGHVEIAICNVVALGITAMSPSVLNYGAFVLGHLAPAVLPEEVAMRFAMHTHSRGIATIATAVAAMTLPTPVMPIAIASGLYMQCRALKHLRDVRGRDEIHLPFVRAVLDRSGEQLAAAAA